MPFVKTEEFELCRIKTEREHPRWAADVREEFFLECEMDAPFELDEEHRAHPILPVLTSICKEHPGAKSEEGFGLQGPCLQRALPGSGGVRFEIGPVRRCACFAKVKLGFPELAEICRNQVYMEVKEINGDFC